MKIKNRYIKVWVITKAGENTKIVFTGEYVDFTSNGLTYVSEKFKNEDIAGSFTLIKGERSKLAELASEIL